MDAIRSALPALRDNSELLDLLDPDMSMIKASTPQQASECASAYIDACLATIRSGIPHSIAYTETDSRFYVYAIGQSVQNDAAHPPIDREEAMRVARAFGLDPTAADFEPRFRDRVFKDHTNRHPQETLASSFLSNLFPK